MVMIEGVWKHLATHMLLMVGVYHMWNGYESSIETEDEEEPSLAEEPEADAVDIRDDALLGLALYWCGRWPFVALMLHFLVLVGRWRDLATYTMPMEEVNGIADSEDKMVIVFLIFLWA